MTAVEKLVTQHLDLWTTAIKRRSTAGRGSSSKVELYGVKKLRELVLELAVRGLLVPQDPEDEPASELLKRIAAEKSKLLKEGKIKKDKPLSPITEDDKSFDLPAGWEWAKLGMLMEMFNGRAFSQTEWSTEGLPIIRIQNLNDKNAPFNYFNGDVAESHCVELGTFLISWSGTPGTSFGAFIWDGAPGALNQHINKCMIFGGEINKQYLRLAVNSCMDHLIENAQGGVGLKHVTKGTLNNCVFAVPPLDEQHRIVTKVNELMALCDQLEQQTDTSLSAHQTLVATLLNALTSTADHAQFASSWQRIAEHFDTLFTAEASIDQLKQTILQLAVMGKLVSQDPDDEPASELLKKIASEKAGLISLGKLKKDRAMDVITRSEKKLDIPSSWESVRLQAIAAIGTGATPARDDSSYYSPAEFSWVTSGETSLPFVSETREKISAKAIAETNVTIYPPGTLIVAMYGQGKTRGQITELLISAGTNQACAAIQLIDQTPAHRAYIKIFFQKAYEDIRSLAEGGAQPNLNVGKIAETVLPLPPLAEQHRIVAKVEELMALCDHLKGRLADAQTTQLHLADALAQQALVEA